MMWSLLIVGFVLFSVAITVTIILILKNRKTTPPSSCTPNCQNKTCGDDGCKGSCGVCKSPSVCFNGTCCTPDCKDKTCGDDGCGGSCGVCSKEETCKDGN